MRDLLIGVTAAAAAAVAVIGPVWAQVSQPAIPQQPAAAYTAQRDPFLGVTPDDAYRNGLINRWQLEQYQGPTPPALQGPSPNGGNQTGGM